MVLNTILNIDPQMLHLHTPLSRHLFVLDGYSSETMYVVKYECVALKAVCGRDPAAKLTGKYLQRAVKGDTLY
jgi:hypothetical protein|tara:strand:+ start:183 stop:401 length:219 start_codon:yes stop_codon:yes gene_type:complete